MILSGEASKLFNNKKNNLQDFQYVLALDQKENQKTPNLILP